MTCVPSVPKHVLLSSFGPEVRACLTSPRIVAASRPTNMPYTKPSTVSCKKIRTRFLFFLTSISDWEFEAVARSLNSKSAPGEDGISADRLLYSLPMIKHHLLAILNAWLLLRIFPLHWKFDKVVVICKPNKPDYSTINSFRLISLVFNMAKLEKSFFKGRSGIAVFKTA